MATIRPEFKSSFLQQLADSIYFRRSGFYYFLGKLDPWDPTSTVPPPADNAYEEDVLIRNNIIYFKKINPNDISLATAVYQWESGTVYTQWDHTQVMEGQPFYVVTDEYNVYKCLNNNNGIPSIVKPATTDLGVIKTADGYLWKYMYNIPLFKRTKFLSSSKLPVQRALTDLFYNRGAVEEVVVTNQGATYTESTPTTIIITDPVGTDESAILVPVVSNVTGSIIDVKIINSGSGYPSAPTLTVSGTGTGKYGSNATALVEAILEPKITDVTGIITAATTTTTITGIPNTSSLKPGMKLNNTFTTPPVGETPGGFGSAPVILSVDSSSQITIETVTSNTPGWIQFDAGGQIERVVITDPGIDYIGDSATAILVNGDGEDAAFSPVVYDGKLIDVVVDNPGRNYSFIDLEVYNPAVDPSNKATVEAIIAASDFLSDQSLVEQTAVPGAIYAIKVTVPGTNYNDGSTVVNIIGDGTGATATAVIVNGGIQRIDMKTYGSGYTRATVEVTDPDRITAINCQAYAILPPVNGHGYDAVKELYADTLSVYSLLKEDVTLNALEQDYRQYGIVINPTDITSNKRLTQDTYFVTYKLTVNDAAGMIEDEILVDESLIRYRVVDIDGTTIELQQLAPRSILQPPEGVLTAENSGAIVREYTVGNIISSPIANKYSGNLIYTINSAPFIPTDESSVSIRTYIRL